MASSCQSQRDEGGTYGRKIKARLILHQLAAGTSRNAVAKALGVSRHGIQATAGAAEREGVSWRDAEGMDEGELCSGPFPEKSAGTGCVYPNPDRDAVHRELRKTGVTLSVYCKLGIACWDCEVGCLSIVSKKLV